MFLYMFILEVYINPDPKNVFKSSQKSNLVTGQMNKHAGHSSWVSNLHTICCRGKKNSNLYSGMKS